MRVPSSECMYDKLSTSLISVTSHIKVNTNYNLNDLTEAKWGPSFIILGLDTWFTKGYQAF